MRFLIERLADTEAGDLIDLDAILLSLKRGRSVSAGIRYLSNFGNIGEIDVRMINTRADDLSLDEIDAATFDSFTDDSESFTTEVGGSNDDGTTGG